MSLSFHRAARGPRSGATAARQCACSPRRRRFPQQTSSSAAASGVSSRAGAPVRAESLASAGPRRPCAPRVPGRRPRAPRSGPLPREDGCRTPGPQLLPLPGALLRPRTLLSPAAADGRSRHRTRSAPPRGGGAEGAPRAPRPRSAGQPAW